MQILLLQDQTEVREKIGFYLESTYGAQVQEAISIENALEMVEAANPPIDLIILDNKKGDAVDFATFWTATEQIPTLLCAQGSPEGASTKANIVGIVDRANFMEGVVSTIDGLIDQGIIAQKKSDQGQVRIRTKLLLAVAPLKGDIYIRLSKSKFVKLFKEGDVFELNDLEKYTIKKGVEYLYIRREQCAEFANKYRLELEKLLKLNNLSIQEVGRLGESIHETVQELSNQVGFTKEVQELTRTHIQLTVKSMGQEPQLADILKKLKASEGKYISSHSTLCAYLACAIAAQLQWGSDTTFYKLTLASFMHDMTLTNHDLAAVNTLEELAAAGNGKFTEAEVKAFKEHPVLAADMIKGMTEVPPDVDMIVRQHHEKPDGSGFPRKMNHSYIAPLASVFIVAHDLAQFSLSSGDTFDAEAFLVKYREKYKSSQFKKILSCIEVLQKIKTLSAAMKSKANS